MILDILCVVNFDDIASAEIEQAANKLHISRSDVVRMAVKSFAAECVPTQSPTLGRDTLCAGQCVPTHARRAGKGVQA